MPRSNHGTEKPKSLALATKMFIRSLRPWLLPIIIAIILSIAATVCSIFGPNILGRMTNSAVEDYTQAIIANGGTVPDVERLTEAINWGKIGQLALTLIILYAVSAILNYIQGVIFRLFPHIMLRRCEQRLLQRSRVYLFHILISTRSAIPYHG